MKDLSKPMEAVGGIRKLLQDVIAPEVQGIKASLTALHEGQQLIRGEMKAQEKRFHEEMQAQEARLTHLIESKAKETILTIQLAESERRSAEALRRSEEAERRNAELVRRLEEASGSPGSAKQ